MENRKIPASMKKVIQQIKTTTEDEKIQYMFENCFSNTYETTIRPQEDGTTFVITGDIPAMWLRDSAAQVRPYLFLAESDASMADMVQGVIQKQMESIVHDPYANAFNETADGSRFNDDETKMSPLVWERKYEIDSLCYPIQLAYLFWKTTGRTNHFNETFQKAVKAVLDLWIVEQNHADSNYHFICRNWNQRDFVPLSRGLALP